MARSREEIQAEQEEVKKRLPSFSISGLDAQVDADIARLGALDLELKELERETASTIAGQVAEGGAGKTTRRATMLSLAGPQTVNSLLLTRRT